MNDIDFYDEVDRSNRAIKDAVSVEQKRLSELGIGSRMDFSLKAAQGPSAERALQGNWALNLARFVVRFAK